MPALNEFIYNGMELIISKSKIIIENCDTLESIINNNKKIPTTSDIDDNISRCIKTFFDCNNDINYAYIFYKINPSVINENLEKLLKDIEKISYKRHYYITIIDFILKTYSYNGLGKRDIKTFINRLRKLMTECINIASSVKSIMDTSNKEEEIVKYD